MLSLILSPQTGARRLHRHLGSERGEGSRLWSGTVFSAGRPGQLTWPADVPCSRVPGKGSLRAASELVSCYGRKESLMLACKVGFPGRSRRLEFRVSECKLANLLLQVA